MPKLEIELRVEQLAKALRALSPEELETLELLLDPDLLEELRRRRQAAHEELAQGKILSEEELFPSEQA